MSNAYIVSPYRSAVGKAFRGSLKAKRPDDLCADVIRGVMKNTPNLDPALIGKMNHVGIAGMQMLLHAP